MDRVCAANRQVKAEREWEEKKDMVWKRKNWFVTLRLFPVICRSERWQCSAHLILNVMFFVWEPNTLYYLLSADTFETSEHFFSNRSNWCSEKGQNVQLQLLISASDTSGNNVLTENIYITPGSHTHYTWGRLAVPLTSTWTVVLCSRSYSLFNLF